jgi:hypothetical protein
MGDPRDHCAHGAVPMQKCRGNAPKWWIINYIVFFAERSRISRHVPDRKSLPDFNFWRDYGPRWLAFAAESATLESLVRANEFAW